ncbi:MAG TPA: helix-hairpin-helix domain-containing protein [Burkholderiaceae bacterium]
MGTLDPVVPLPRAAIKAPKAATAEDCHALEQLPNVGPAMAADLRLLGIHTPQALKGRDGLQLYRALCEATGQRHDPCVLDTLLAVVDFMHGAPPAPWWAYTKQRKALGAL